MKWMLNIGENKSKGLPKTKRRESNFLTFSFQKKSIFRWNNIESQRVHNKSLVWSIYVTREVKWIFLYKREQKQRFARIKRWERYFLNVSFKKEKYSFFFFFFLVRVLMDLCRPAFGQAWGFCYSRFSCSDFSLFFFEPWITCPAQIYK